MCSGTLEFPPQTPQQRKQTRRRPLGNKLQEIASRSPNDIRALDVLADFILDRLDEEARSARNA